ncbi:MAG: hypothetical protein R6X02_11015 [Enhygromyxa sp.]
MRGPNSVMSIICALLLGSAACGDKPKPPKKASRQALERSSEAAVAEVLPDQLRVEIGNPGADRCVRTLCIGGPGELTDEPNIDLGELCRRAPGVVRRCEGERCRSLWSLEQWPEGLEALIGSLDHDGDGRVDGADPKCRINLAGWSRGAVIAAEQIPRALREDQRVAEGRAVVEHLVAIAPWAPDRTQLDVAANVRKAWIYRHAKTPKHDCSKDFEDGPWLSPPPVCGPDTQCWDYDYSFEPQLAFVGRRGARSGEEVGHCNIVSLVAKLGLDNLARGIEAPREHVPLYSNGEHGGRVHRGPLRPDPIKRLDNPPAPD